MRSGGYHSSPSGGRYFMQRGWQQHPAFPHEPFTAREAWEWLISNAFWKAGRARAGNYIVDLTRGQLCASVRYMADSWRWTPSKVERFLKRLKTEAMIETRSETGINIITICNYDKYQTLSSDSETPSDTRSGTASAQTRYKKEKPQKHYEHRDSEESLSLFGATESAKPKAHDPPGYPDAFEQFWSLYPRHNGSKKEAYKHYQRRIREGIEHETIIAGVRRYYDHITAKPGGLAYVKHAHRWLINECWTIDYAAIHATGGAAAGSHGKQSESARYIDSARRIIEERNERSGRLAQSTEAQNMLSKLIACTYIMQKKYGEHADHAQLHDAAFQKALGRFTYNEVEKAFEIYTSRHDDMPRHSNILNILEPPLPQLSTPMYVEFKQRMKWTYVGQKEREYCARYEEQELSKLEPWDRRARQIKSAHQEPQQLTYDPDDCGAIDDE